MLLLLVLVILFLLTETVVVFNANRNTVCFYCKTTVFSIWQSVNNQQYRCSNMISELKQAQNMTDHGSRVSLGQVRKSPWRSMASFTASFPYRIQGNLLKVFGQIFP